MARKKHQDDMTDDNTNERVSDTGEDDDSDVECEEDTAGDDAVDDSVSSGDEHDDDETSADAAQEQEVRGRITESRVPKDYNVVKLKANVFFGVSVTLIAVIMLVVYSPDACRKLTALGRARNHRNDTAYGAWDCAIDGRHMTSVVAFAHEKFNASGEHAMVCEGAFCGTLGTQLDSIVCENRWYASGDGAAWWKCHAFVSESADVISTALMFTQNGSGSAPGELKVRCGRARGAGCECDIRYRPNKRHLDMFLLFSTKE